MATWKNLKDFCDDRNYDIVEARKFFGNIIRKVAGVQELDLDKVDEVIAVKARPLSKQADRIWASKYPAKIDRHIERKRDAIVRRRQQQEVVDDQLKREKNPRRRRILAKRIHNLALEISGFELEIQKCESRIDELTFIKEDVSKEESSTDEESTDTE